jgi:hypothetical protein
MASTAVSLATLLVQATKEQIYEYALGVARVVGLPVDTWQAGDPTRSEYHLEAEILVTLEEVVVGFIRSGFLDYAAELAKAAPGNVRAAMWLKILAKQVYNVDVPEATYATPKILLTNNAGGFYEDIEPGSITVKNPITGKTYHNTQGGPGTNLASGPGTTLSLDFIADEAGAESAAGPDEITEMVTTLLGVTCSNPLAAVATDEQDPDTTVQQCRDKLSSLSPNGPRGAYSYVARETALTGTNAVTRAREYGDSDTGDVTVYLAGPSGAVAEVDRALVETAILKWSTPLCITPTVLSATPVPIAVTYQVWVYKRSNKTAAELEDEILTALENLFARRDIGGDIIPPATTGSMYHSLIESTIRGVNPEIFRVALTVPSADTAIGNGQVAALSTVTATVNLVVDP